MADIENLGKEFQIKNGSFWKLSSLEKIRYNSCLLFLHYGVYFSLEPICSSQPIFVLLLFLQVVLLEVDGLSQCLWFALFQGAWETEFQTVHDFFPAFIKNVYGI